MGYEFNAIAGYKREKEELKKLCDIFNNREIYQKKGARLPKGIIFYGEPGTGKTLFAKVMASVCGLEVFKIDLGDVSNESEICGHIKKTFLKAQKRKVPTMIFFDEMDKVLPTRDYMTDRSKTILTQLLTLIDGMDSASNIVFVATCNYYGSLPEVLTRPGRLDKKIGIGMPSYFSRVEILKMYSKRGNCTFEMPMETLAEMTSGFSCAALETLVNECMLQSDENNFISERLISSKVFEIKQEDIPRPRSTVDDMVYACRNVGAFIVGQVLHASDYTLDLSSSVCNDYYNHVLSYYDDFSDDEDDDYDDDDYDDDDECDCDDCDCDDCADCDDDEDGDDDGRESFFNREQLIEGIVVLLGGYVAQELLLGSIYDNMKNYISTVDAIFLSMVSNGMLGLSLTYSNDRDRLLSYTSQRVVRLNEAFDTLVDGCYQRAKEILENNLSLLKKLVELLVGESMVLQEDAEAFIERHGGIRK